MRKYLYIISLFVATFAQAQDIRGTSEELRRGKITFTDRDTLDTHPVFEVQYTRIDVDTVKEKDLTQEMMLLIGKKATLYYSYGHYLQDSLARAKEGNITFGDLEDLTRKYTARYFERIARFLASNVFLEDNSILMNRLQTYDTIPAMQWTHEADTMRICGYLCRKATTDFRGRRWTAWWAEELPSDAGPWKLHGLPGLILRADDDRGMHHLEAHIVREAYVPMITRFNARYRTLPFRAYRKEMKEYALNYAERVKRQNLFQSNAKPGRRFYSPYEDE